MTRIARVPANVNRMPPESSTARSALELVEVTADLAPVLRNLFELYLHDFSETLGLRVDERGLFLSEKEWQAIHARSRRSCRVGWRMSSVTAAARGRASRSSRINRG